MSSDTSKTPGYQNQKLTRIFVYGSLKQGYALHSQLTNQLYLGTACTVAEYRLFDCGTYPGIVKVVDSGVSVKGEVYEVDDDCLRQLDDVEGVSEGLYERNKISLMPPHSLETVQAYFYLKPTTGLKDCDCEWPAGS